MKKRNVCEWEQVYFEAKIEISKLKNQFPDEYLFGDELGHSLESSIANIYQTFGGKDLYPSLEEKAAMLFYSVIKNHSIVSGDKRIASALFKWFLTREGYNISKIDDDELEVLTSVIAKSDNRLKDKIIERIKKIIT
ncbi:MAG: type II toxin-antitoxin system death-on-curing family toxin [Prevotella sp.]|nr:type II toxin-antitoxin system death-on-curing family toxin [Prevotella sp.]